MAFKRLTQHDDFKKWIKLECSRRSQDIKKIEKEINDQVDNSIKEENLKIETF